MKNKYIVIVRLAKRGLTLSEPRKKSTSQRRTGSCEFRKFTLSLGILPQSLRLKLTTQALGFIIINRDAPFSVVVETTIMVAITIRKVRFNIYPNDHNPPHIDAEIDGMKMKIYFGTKTAPPKIGATNPRIKDPAIKRAFEIFQDNETTLRKRFEEVQNAKISK